MRALLLPVLLAFVVPDRPDPAPKEKPKTFHEQLLGDWQFVGVTVSGGGEVPKKEDENRVLRFTPTEVIALVNGVVKQEDGGKYTLDTSKQPYAMDLVPNQKIDNRNVHGILKMEGDQLTIAFAIDGARPAQFEPAPNALTVTVHLKRVKR